MMDEFLNRSEKILGKEPPGLTLIVDAIPDGNELDGVPAMFYQSHYGQDPNALYARVRNVKEMVAAIQAIQASGHKIARVDGFIHGKTSYNFFHSVEPITAVYFAEDILTTDPGRYRRMFPTPKGEPESRIVALNQMPDLSGAFVKDAQIRFISCEAGQQAPGEQFLEGFGGKTVGPKGGKLVAATVPVLVASEEFPESKRIELEAKHAAEVKKLDEKKENRTPLGKAGDFLDAQARENVIVFIWTMAAPIALTHEYLTHEDVIKAVTFPSRP